MDGDRGVQCGVVWCDAMLCVEWVYGAVRYSVGAGRGPGECLGLEN